MKIKFKCWKCGGEVNGEELDRHYRTDPKQNSSDGETASAACPVCGSFNKVKR